MSEAKILTTCLARLCTAIGIFSASLPAFGACTAPDYRIGRTLESTASEIFIHISIRLEDFAPVRLACLAEALKRKYPGRNVSVGIFSAKDAAQGWVPEAERTAWTVYSTSKFHAYYTYDKEKHDDNVFLMPDGQSQQVNSPFNTRIDLPLTGLPVCKLALHDRCLLEFQTIYYPNVEGKTEDVTGQVTLAGSIQRNGVVTNLAVVEAKSDPPGRRSVLVNYAMQNLGTWHFESGKTKDTLHITYDFKIVDHPATADGVQMNLPDRVTVETERSR